MLQETDKDLIAYSKKEFKPMHSGYTEAELIDSSITKIEFGGGYCSKEDYWNFDIDDRFADTVIDFERNKLPIRDDQITHVYSAHCLEHISVGALFDLLKEVLRVCKIGAEILIKVPHWNHPISMYPGHVHTVSDRWWRDNTDFPERWVPKNIQKCLHLDSLSYQPDVDFYTYRNCEAFKAMSDEDILKLMPAACHEIHVRMTVIHYAHI